MVARLRSRSRERGRWVGSWPGYLASSWTWVIGLFLPALAIRDFGLLGWIAFAVPNVVGAGALGWFLTPERSRRLCEEHGPAMAVFSLTTALFHLAVLGWLARVFLGDVPALLVLAAALAVAVLAARAWVPMLGAALWALSALLFLAWSAFGPAWEGLAPTPGSGTRLGWPDLTVFVGAAALGFLACPVLDRTLHRPFESGALRRGRAAYGLGFGLCFLILILFSASYAVSVQGWLVLPASVIAGALVLLAVHLSIQIAYTLGLHLAEVRRHLEILAQVWPLAGLALVPPLLGMLVAGLGLSSPFDLGWPETVYRLFLLAYGVVFPAYVAAHVLPRSAAIPSAAGRGFWVSIGLLALPLGGYGFLGGGWWAIALSGAPTLVLLAWQASLTRRHRAIRGSGSGTPACAGRSPP